MVGTQIVDVVRGYGDVPGVFLANGAEAFAEACDAALLLSRSDAAWLEAVDGVLAQSSWDNTFRRMSALVEQAAAQKIVSAALPERFRVGTSRRAPSDTYDYLIVGAGFAGSVLAERLAADGGKRSLSATGGPISAATPTITTMRRRSWSTSMARISSIPTARMSLPYLSRFTAWRPYEHRVLAQVGDLRLPIPINRTTLNALYNLDLASDAEAARFLADRAEPCDPLKTSRDVVISQVGAELYRTFFEGYTRKQWGLDPSELDRSVTARIPTRTNTDDRYFLDRFQAMPLGGYTRMFERMLNHDNITVLVGTDFADLRREGLADHTIFTGPIDEYFGHCFGRLPYRSLKFTHETHDVRRLLPVAVINYPSEDVPYTRVTEYKHLTGQVHPRTSISYEYASAEGEPYYPIPRPENQALYKQYETLARTRVDVTFVGRLGTYKYYNMDQVVGQALATYRRLRDRRGARRALAYAPSMTKKPHVLLATDSFNPSGMGEHMLALGRGLSDRWNVTIAVMAEDRMGLLARAARCGLAVKLIQDVGEFHEWLSRSSVDILHVHAGIGWEGHDLAAAADACAIPIIRTEHLPYLLNDPEQIECYRRETERLAHRIVVSEASRRSFCEARIAPSLMTVVRNGIFPLQPVRSATAFAQELGLVGRTVLLTVARFTAQKDQASLVRALLTVLKDHPSVVLLFVGTGPEEECVTALAAKLDVGDHVQFLGHRSDVAELMAIADLFILTSHFEGLPLAVLEAMSLAVPVIATRIGGTVEALGDDHPFFTEPGNPAAIAAVIHQALADPHRLAESGRA